MSPPSELLTYDLDGKVATITMDDGKANALSIEMLNSLHEAVGQAERDEAVVLLTGREGRFSAGFDLKVFRDEPERLPEMLRLGATLTERLLSLPRPVIIACNGHAIAAAAFLLLAVDYRLGTEGDFQIGLNEVKIGLTVPLFVVELARGRLQPAHFNRAVVNAAMYGPDEAVTAGFLDRVVPVADLSAAGRTVAAEHAELNLDAHAATKLRARERQLEALRTAIEAEFPATNA